LPPPAAAPVATPAPQPAVVLTGIPKEQAQLLAQSGFVDAGPGGFGVRSASKESQLRFHLQVQADAKFWHGTTPAKVNETFFLRRAIPWIDGTLPYGVSFLLAPDFSQINSTNTAAQANAAIILPDAYFQIKILDELQFRFGKFRAPIGLERLQPTGQLFFNEFALATELTPLRDLGAQVQGEIAKGYAGYALGVFNGAVDNAYTDLDPSRYKDFEGRVFAQPLGAPTRIPFSTPSSESPEPSVARAECRRLPASPRICRPTNPRGRCDLFVQDRQHAWPGGHGHRVGTAAKDQRPRLLFCGSFRLARGVHLLAAAGGLQL